MIADTAYSVRDDDGRRWPAPDGIAFLRAGREALADAALERLDAGDRIGALVLLLADQDDWWQGPTADPAALRELVARQATLTLREAMALLSWGPVADYFAHRWSDPTFLAGLALVEAHCPAPTTVFELACGIGHHLRELALRGAEVTGADVVFAKLWVARHWVVPGARLVCVDAAQDWPVQDGAFDLVACQDAFYFLEPKRAIRAKLQRLLGPAGVLAIGHVHNRDWPNFSAGSAMSADDALAMFPGAVFYDDAELTEALAVGRAPRPAAPDALAGAEAFAIVTGPGLGPARAVEGGLALPPPGASLLRNPLYGSSRRRVWPSERYGREYGPRATYPEMTAAPPYALLDSTPSLRAQARRRELVALPERW
ncbi:MAG: class I SAM-dependent methyltransferase [Pseudomonadota bacterium]